MTVKKLIIAFASIALLTTLVFISDVSAQPPGDTDETLLLWPDGAPGAKGQTDSDQPTLTVFLPEPSKATGTGVVIFPGGGYRHLAKHHEGYQVARWLNDIGVAAFVAEYRLGMRYHHPAPFDDAQHAIKTVRVHAQKWGISAEKLGVLGFSAGGHLASTTGTHFNAANPKAEDPLNRPSSKPNFMILVYPVITMQLDYTHQGSRRNLLGKEPPASLVSHLSNELQVTGKTPPTFLVHGSNDSAVPVQNSLQFYESLLDHGVPAEMHLFEDGPHGFGLAAKDPELSTWTDLCENWLRRQNLLTP